MKSGQRLKMQKWMAPFIITLVVMWLFFILALVVLDGSEVLDYHPSVLVTLIRSATISIVGILMKFANYTLPEIKWSSTFFTT